MSVISGNFNPHLFLWDTNLNYTLITSLSTHIEFNDVRSLFQLILSYTTCKLSLLWFSKYNEPEGKGHFVCMYIYLGEQWPFFIHELIVFCILLSSILLNIRTDTRPLQYKCIVTSYMLEFPSVVNTSGPETGMYLCCLRCKDISSQGVVYPLRFIGSLFSMKTYFNCLCKVLRNGSKRKFIFTFSKIKFSTTRFKYNVCWQSF